MIKTIAVDLGGVYFTDGTNMVKPRLLEILRATPQQYETIFRGEKSELYYEGRITGKEFWSFIKENMHIDETATKEARKVWFGAYKPNEGMPALIHSLHESYRTIIFSGNLRDRVKYLDRKFKFLKDFDDAIFSFDVGMRKENPAMYKILVENLKCEPKQAVYIDDAHNLLEHAKKLGINIIHFEGAAQLALELKNYGVQLGESTISTKRDIRYNNLI